VRRFLFACAVVALPGCGDAAARSGEPRAAVAAPATSLAAADSAPSPQAVLRALLASTSVPLTADSSCAGVGTSPDDRTIGDFLAGFLAEYGDSTGTNWVRVASEPVNEAGERRWRHTVVLHRRAGEDVWGWGVRFDVRAADRQVVRASFRCLG
jgi:hypothetical protein